MAQTPAYQVTLRAVLLFEKLTARSFTSIDFESEEDAVALIYCLQRCAPEGSRMPFEQWRSVLKSPAVRADCYRALGLALDELGALSLPAFGEASAPSSPAPEAPAQTFTEIATTLIVTGGLSAEYVMDRMELWELPALLKALDARTREALERSRLFTWLGMLPHLASDSAQSPEKLLPFPWEHQQEDQERRALYDILGTAHFTPE